ncbi:hypothetical protein ACWDYH_00435 [Nocardia goodfellowii]
MIGVTEKDFSVASPTLLYAHTKIIDGQLRLEVNQSVRVKDYHPLYVPVAAYLSAHTHERISKEKIRNVDLMGRWGIRTTYTILGRRLESLLTS